MISSTANRRLLHPFGHSPLGASWQLVRPLVDFTVLACACPLQILGLSNGAHPSDLPTVHYYDTER